MTRECVVFKVIVIGESGVGKTSLSKRFQLNEFQSRSSKETVVADIWKKDIQVMGKKVRLVISDTAGQERYKSLVLNYFRHVDGVLLVYDVTDIMTFNKLSGWLQEVRDNALESVILVVGNKTDHSKAKAVSRSIVRRFTQEEGLEFIETSAKNGENVQQVFEFLTGKILLKKCLVPPDTPIVVLPSESSSEISSGCTEPLLIVASDSPSVSQQLTDTLANNENRPDILLGTCNYECTERKSSTLPSIQQHSVEEDFDIVNHDDCSSNYIVRDLPPVVPLDDSVLELALDRRRKMSSDSLSSLVTDLAEFNRIIELHREAQKSAHKKSNCFIM